MSSRAEPQKAFSAYFEWKAYMDSTIQDLIRDLKSSSPAKQSDAAQQLAGLAEEAQPAIVALVEACGSADEDISNWCTAALESVGPPHSDQLAALIQFANSKQENTAYWAITLLGRAGSAAEAAVPMLEDLLNTAAPNIKRRVSWALKKIESS